MLVAVVQDGVWTQIDDGRPAVNPKADSHVIDTPCSDPVDRIAGHFGQVVRLAQTLTPTDQRRVRDLVHAMQGMLNATTYLPEPDQKLFERSLRGD